MIGSLIDRYRRVRLPTRLVLFYVCLIILGVSVNLFGVSRFAIMPAGIMIGFVIGGGLYNFKPYKELWGWIRCIFTRLGHILLTMMTAMVTLNFFFLNNGVLIGDTVGWGDRVALFVFVALGVILTAVILGKRRFTPTHPL